MIIEIDEKRMSLGDRNELSDILGNWNGKTYGSAEELIGAHTAAQTLSDEVSDSVIHVEPEDVIEALPKVYEKLKDCITGALEDIDLKDDCESGISEVMEDENDSIVSYISYLYAVENGEEEPDAGYAF